MSHICGFLPPIELTWECVADKLIREKLLLTVLELYLELQEKGRDLLVLKEYFSNPINFEVKSAVETHLYGGSGLCEYGRVCI